MGWRHTPAGAVTHRVSVGRGGARDEAGREAPDARRPATRDAVRARPTPCCVQRRDERRLSPALRVKQGLCFLHRE